MTDVQVLSNILLIIANMWCIAGVILKEWQCGAMAALYIAGMIIINV